MILGTSRRERAVGRTTIRNDVIREMVDVVCVLRVGINLDDFGQRADL